MPDRIHGGRRFWDRAHTRDLTAYLRVVDQPADDLAFERIVNTPKRGLGDKSVATLSQIARGQRISLSSAATFVANTDELPQRARSTLARLTGDFERWREKRDQLSPSELADLVMEESGYITMLKTDRSIEER